MVLYSLFQYRALGPGDRRLAVVAGAHLRDGRRCLGWAQGFRLTLAGVTGLIVSIGITADSFIVYFERVRDEVRDGPDPARGRRDRLGARPAHHPGRRLGHFLAAAVLFLLAAAACGASRSRWA